MSLCWKFNFWFVEYLALCSDKNYKFHSIDHSWPLLDVWSIVGRTTSPSFKFSAPPLWQMTAHPSNIIDEQLHKTATALMIIIITNIINSKCHLLMIRVEACVSTTISVRFASARSDAATHSQSERSFVLTSSLQYGHSVGCIGFGQGTRNQSSKILHKTVFC